jgi:DNA polymerase elongation subunit (family B)
MSNEIDYSKLSDEQLLELRAQTVKNIAKYDNYQMAIKIRLNSLYGSIGNQYFRYYKLENAEAITMSGQVSIRWIEDKLNLYLNSILGTRDKDFIIALDTDSVYLHLGPIVDTYLNEKNLPTEKIVDILQKIAKDTIEPYIDKSYKELANYLNAYDQKMHMKREAIADRGIWTAKKRYVLNVWDNEGVRYESPKLKILGLEMIKSDTPKVCREMLKEAIKIIMTKEENDVIKYIKNCKTKYFEMEPEQIGISKSANNILKYSDNISIYKKKTPIQVRGALLYNHYLNKHNLKHKHSLINNGEKIKYIYLKVPNIIQEDVISFISTIPKEFNLKKHIDYERQFEKTFLNPLETILKTIGWKSKQSTSVMSMFE